MTNSLVAVYELEIPLETEPGVIYLVTGWKPHRPRVAVLLCPCCGDRVLVLKLDMLGGRGWRVVLDCHDKPTLTPSTVPECCGAEFSVREGVVILEEESA